MECLTVVVNAFSGIALCSFPLGPTAWVLLPWFTEFSHLDYGSSLNMVLAV